MPLILLTLFTGYLLVNAAVKNEHPLASIITAFGGSAPPVPGRDPLEGAVEAGRQTGSPPKQGGETSGAVGTSAGTSEVQAFHAAVVDRFGDQLTSAGVCACRTIRPHSGGSSSTWSQHAWCAAEDWRGSAAAMARLMAWGSRPSIRRRYKIRNLIPPGTAINVVHVDFNPPRTGTPPCAKAA